MPRPRRKSTQDGIGGGRRGGRIRDEMTVACGTCVKLIENGHGPPPDRQRAGDLQRVLNETRGKHGDNDINHRN